MMVSALKAFCTTQSKILEMTRLEHSPLEHFTTENPELFRKVITDSLAKEPPLVRERVWAEYFENGPLEDLFDDTDITEILVNGPQSIWFEKEGRLFQAGDHFLSEQSYNNFFNRLCEQVNCPITVEVPSGTGVFKDFRLSLVGKELTRSHPHLSFRRHPKNPWTLERLQEQDWASPGDFTKLRNILEQRKNFLIIGGTGSGKTSMINALLHSLPKNERILMIEDTPELHIPNSSSMKMVTREDPQGLLAPVDQTQLLRHALRMRPDRIVLGEIRGSEAKDFLMAMATGHSGSFGTLHAQDPHQALIRLEMLIQMGAPQWGLEAIRRLIHLSLQNILVVGKTSEGKRKLQGVYEIASLEDHGFLLDKI